MTVLARRSLLAAAASLLGAGACSTYKTQTADFAALKGRWLRRDGGYVIEIKSVGPDGSMETAYYNPQPIHVSLSEARWLEGSARVLLELRDRNYPGSTYRLTYDRQADTLNGEYFQAALRETFPVTFTRMVPGQAPDSK